VMSAQPSPMISVKEARKLLGKEAAQMTDVQVINIIDDMETLCGLFFISGEVQKSSPRQERPDHVHVTNKQKGSK
jgi:hypothetical protein